MPRRLRRLIATLIACCVLSTCGCTTLRSVHLSNLSVPKESGREISAKVSKVLILGIGFSTSYVFEARQRLYALCPDGVVTGVLSVFESTNALLLSVETVRVKAYCVPPN